MNNAYLCLQISSMAADLASRTLSVSEESLVWRQGLCGSLTAWRSWGKQRSWRCQSKTSSRMETAFRSGDFPKTWMVFKIGDTQYWNSTENIQITQDLTEKMDIRYFRNYEAVVYLFYSLFFIKMQWNDHLQFLNSVHGIFKRKTNVFQT